MKLKKHGKSTSQVEVVGITLHGLWMHINSSEYFLPFEEYPWFKEAKLKYIQNVKLIHDHHLVWEDIDVDLDINTFINLEKYPLKYSH